MTAKAESIKATSNGRTQQARMEISKDWKHDRILVFVNKNESSCGTVASPERGYPRRLY